MSIEYRVSSEDLTRRRAIGVGEMICLITPKKVFVLVATRAQDSRQKALPDP